MTDRAAKIGVVGNTNIFGLRIIGFPKIEIQVLVSGFAFDRGGVWSRPPRGNVTQVLEVSRLAPEAQGMALAFGDILNRKRLGGRRCSPWRNHQWSARQLRSENSAPKRNDRVVRVHYGGVRVSGRRAVS